MAYKSWYDRQAKKSRLPDEEKKKRVQVETLGMHTHICPVCGREFECRQEYAYKRFTKDKKSIYFCSWSCLRKAE